MKKLSKLLLVAMIGVLLTTTGCNNKNVDNNQTDNSYVDNNTTKKETVATKLVNVFEEKIKDEKDIEKVANAIATNENMEIAVDVMKAEEGYLDGFNGDIKGFTNAYSIKPIIGSQPFVAYVFETDDADALKTVLEEKADKRWNICTEADELEISVVDNYVFLIMSPASFD